MRKTLKYFSITLVALLFSYLCVVSILAPFRYRKQLNSIALSDSLLINDFSPVLLNPTLDSLVRIEVYKQSLLNLTRTDSIGLSIKISDSIAFLMLKGVEIHQTKISKYSLDPILSGLHLQTYKLLFSKPLVCKNSYASFMKEPIVVKKAPKTPEEALAMATIPDSVASDPAYFWLEIDHGIRLFFIQDQWNTKKERKIKQQFLSDYRNLKRSNIFKSIINPSKIYYSPTIIIKTQADEVRSIYRALPYQSKVSLSF